MPRRNSKGRPREGIDSREQAHSRHSRKQSHHRKRSKKWQQVQRNLGQQA